jgi:carboxymethylenebutenolidase
MRGQMTEFRANGRTASGYLSLPATKSGPGLIVIQEWWGLVDHIKAVADRFAAAGFVTLAPDLYDGEATTNPDEAGRLAMALNIAQAAKDIKAAAGFLLAHPSVKPKKVAALGFCMGGALALYAATEYPGQFAGAVDYYGAHPAVHVDPSKLRVPLLAHFGAHDKSIKEADARELMDRLKSTGQSLEAYFYDAGHAFFNDARPQVYNEAAATQSWDRTLTFLRRVLV